MFNYLFSFRGRINRANMWLFLVVQAVWMTIWFLTRPWVSHVLAAHVHNPTVMRHGSIVLLVGPLLYPFVAVFVKRLHDRNKSWWWFVILFVLPMALMLVGFMLSMGAIGWVNSSDTTRLLGRAFLGIGQLGYLWYFIELFCLRGTVGQNRFGPDPLAGNG